MAANLAVEMMMYAADLAVENVLPTDWGVEKALVSDLAVDKILQQVTCQ